MFGFGRKQILEELLSKIEKGIRKMGIELDNIGASIDALTAEITIVSQKIQELKANATDTTTLVAIQTRIDQATEALKTL